VFCFTDSPSWGLNRTCPLSRHAEALKSTGAVSRNRGQMPVARASPVTQGPPVTQGSLAAWSGRTPPTLPLGVEAAFPGRRGRRRGRGAPPPPPPPCHRSSRAARRSRPRTLSSATPAHAPRPAARAPIEGKSAIAIEKDCTQLCDRPLLLRRVQCFVQDERNVRCSEHDAHKHRYSRQTATKVGVVWRLSLAQHGRASCQGCAIEQTL
jgi:hypothetical protein